MTSQWSAMVSSLVWCCLVLLVFYVQPGLCARGGRVKARTHIYGGNDYEDDELHSIKGNISFVFPISHKDRFGDCNDKFPEVIPEDEAVRYIHLLVFPPLILLGIVGNVVAFPVLYSLSKTSWSTARYLALLTLTDIIILLVHCGDKWYQAIEDDVWASLQLQTTLRWGDVECKVYNVSYEFTKLMNVWLMVAVAVETAIVARWPDKTHVMCTLDRGLHVLLILTVGIFCLTVHYFWTYAMKNFTKEDRLCWFVDYYPDEFDDIHWPIIVLISKCILPLLTVSAFFYLAVSGLVHRSDEEEESLKNEMSKHVIEVKGLFELRNICVIFCLIFICVTTMDTALQFTDIVYTVGPELSCYESGRYDIVNNLMSTVVAIFQAFFYSSKIFFYIKLGQFGFRQRMKDQFVTLGTKIASCCCCCCNRKRTDPAENVLVENPTA